MSKAAVDRLATWRPLGLLQDLVHTIADVATGVAETNARLTRLENLMTDVSGVLSQVADGLRGPLSTSIQELIAENQRLAADNATLSGEDAAESTAAASVKDAFDQVAGLFAPVPDVPDVAPLPEPGTADDGSTPDEPSA